MNNRTRVAHHKKLHDQYLVADVMAHGRIHTLFGDCRGTGFIDDEDWHHAIYMNWMELHVALKCGVQVLYAFIIVVIGFVLPSFLWFVLGVVILTMVFGCMVNKLEKLVEERKPMISEYEVLSCEVYLVRGKLVSHPIYRRRGGL